MFAGALLSSPRRRPLGWTCSWLLFCGPVNENNDNRSEYHPQERHGRKHAPSTVLEAIRDIHPKQRRQCRQRKKKCNDGVEPMTCSYESFTRTRLLLSPSCH